MKKTAEGFSKYGTMDAMTARHDHDDPSRGPSFHRILTDFQQLVSLFYKFFLRKCKNLIFGVRIFVG